MTAEYPKMLTKKVKGKIVPVVYPVGHAQAGAHVIFNTKHDERDYDGSGVLADSRPEQHSQPEYSYVYTPPLWTKTS
jgi:hypothetical protein